MKMFVRMMMTAYFCMKSLLLVDMMKSVNIIFVCLNTIDDIIDDDDGDKNKNENDDGENDDNDESDHDENICEPLASGRWW